MNKKFANIAFDASDRKIIEHLRRDCRISNAQLADAVGLSASACWRRVRSLEDTGVIAGYGARIDPAGEGLGFQAIVQVHLTRHDADHVGEFVKAMQASPSVRECYATTGQADYHLHVLCRDLEHYNAFLEQELFVLSAVSGVQTNLVLRSLKEH